MAPRKKSPEPELIKGYKTSLQEHQIDQDKALRAYYEKAEEFDEKVARADRSIVALNKSGEGEEQKVALTKRIKDDLHTSLQAWWGTYNTLVDLQNTFRKNVATGDRIYHNTRLIADVVSTIADQEQRAYTFTTTIQKLKQLKTTKPETEIQGNVPTFVAFDGINGAFYVMEPASQQYDATGPITYTARFVGNKELSKRTMEKTIDSLEVKSDVVVNAYAHVLVGDGEEID